MPAGYTADADVLRDAAHTLTSPRRPTRRNGTRVSDDLPGRMIGMNDQYAVFLTDDGVAVHTTGRGG